MQATEILKEEHHGVKLALRILDPLCAQLAAVPFGQGTVYSGDLAQLIDFFGTFVDKCHHAKEEEVLFPVLLEEGVPHAKELIQLLLAEHAEGRNLVATMAEGLTAYQAGDENAMPVLNTAAKNYAQLLTDHIAKEDHYLYPIADEKVTANEQKEMIETFEKIETERIGLGTHEKFHVMLSEFRTKYLQK
ncbi:MAG: hemerythrin domain-containing protein [Negativicutes bacterium]